MTNAWFVHLLDGRRLPIHPTAHTPGHVEIDGPRGGYLGTYDTNPLRELLRGARDRASGQVSGDLDLRARRQPGAPVTLEFCSAYGRTSRSFQVAPDELERIAGLLPSGQRGVSAEFRVPAGMTADQVAGLLRRAVSTTPELELVDASLDNTYHSILDD